MGLELIQYSIDYDYRKNLLNTTDIISLKLGEQLFSLICQKAKPLNININLEDLIIIAKELESNRITNMHIVEPDTSPIQWVFSMLDYKNIYIFIDICINCKAYTPDELLLYILTYLLGNCTSRGHIDSAYYVIDKYKANYHLANIKNCSLYTYCIFYGDVINTENLIKKGINVNEKIESSDIYIISRLTNILYNKSKIISPLCFANYAICKLLLENGADVNQMKKPIKVNSEQHLQLFLQYGIHINDMKLPIRTEKTMNKDTLITIRKPKFDLKLFEQFLECGAPYNINTLVDTVYKPDLTQIINSIIMGLNLKIKSIGSSELYSIMVSNNDTLIDYLDITSSDDLVYKVNEYISHIPTI